MLCVGEAWSLRTKSHLKPREVASRPPIVVDMQFGDTVSASADPPLSEIDTSFGNAGYEVSGDGQRFMVNRQRQGDVLNVPITVVLNWWTELARSS